MEAVSRGAAQAGGHVIGVTCQEIENWRSLPPNPWLKEEWRFASLHERMLALMDASDAVIALPGGAGTLAEIALLWNRLLIQAIPPRPLILVGEGWRQVFDRLFETQGVFISQPDRRWLSFAADVREAVAQIKDSRSSAA
jgi:predicted Rossmann-fold nucleotide-binding protein